MDFVIPIIKVIHILVCIFLVVIVLLQPGKGGDLGSVFGGGTSESVFGASGAVPFLTKLTRLLAVIFFLTSLSLGYFSVTTIKSSVIKANPVIQQETSPESSEQIPVSDGSVPLEQDSTLSAPEMLENTGDAEQTGTDNN